MDRLPALGSLRSIANAYDEDEVSDEELELSKAKKRKLSTDEGEKSETKADDSDFDIVVSDEEGNSSGAGSVKNAVVVSQPRVTKASRLVSYGGDEEEDDNASKVKENEIQEVEMETSTSAEVPRQPETTEPSQMDIERPSTRAESQPTPEPQQENDKKGMLPKELLDHLAAVKSIQVVLPVEPEGRCSNSLQEKIENLLETKQRTGRDLKYTIQRKKNFRNPSIYDKLVAFCAINEIGTNYPTEIYNPFSWGEDSFYERLSKIQKEHHEKKQKERSKVEFISATKRNTAASALGGASTSSAGTSSGASTSSVAASSSTATDEASRRRKSKWDVTSAGTASHTRPPQSAIQTIASIQAVVAATDAANNKR